jgi:hypothetical protein
VILFISGATKTIRELPDKQHLGHLLVPADGNSMREVQATGLPFAADNGAFAGFDPAAFCRLLGRIAGKPGCRFVACPDVVGNARETALLFYKWQPIIKSLGLPVALVLQDGQETQGVPWNMIDALFIGGSTEFKLGPIAAKSVREGKRRGLWIHGGRVNTRQRFRYMAEIGCDSCDGSGFSKWPDQKIPLALKWMKEIERQPSFLAA